MTTPESIRRKSRELKERALYKQHRAVWMEELQALENQRISMVKRIRDATNRLVRKYATMEDAQDLELIMSVRGEVTDDEDEEQEEREVDMEGHVQLEEALRNCVAGSAAFCITGDLIDPWVMDPNQGVCKFTEAGCIDRAVCLARLGDYEKIHVSYVESIAGLQEEFEVFVKCAESWSERDQFRFEKIAREYAALDKQRAFYHAHRLKLEFRDRSKAELEDHIVWLTKHNAYKSRLVAIKENFTSTIAKFISASLALYSESDARVRKQCETEKAAFENLARADKCHEQIRSWRDSRISKIREAEEAERMEFELAQRVRQREEKKREVARDKARGDVQEYQRLVILEKERQQMIEDQLKESYRAVEISHQHKNIERIKYRDTKFMIKKEDQRKKMSELELKRAEAMQRLEKLRQQVAVNFQVESDWDRIQRPTESLKQANASIKLGAQPPLFPCHGFTNEKVFMDKRAKISLALFESGLSSSSYASALIQNMYAPRAAAN
ncbi:hypothetical protein HK101_003836 [Irineochytrium annulatum]|nr:hypothetical protein HK101_003836 [Irineochytrium annulatum]